MNTPEFKDVFEAELARLNAVAFPEDHDCQESEPVLTAVNDTPLRVETGLQIPSFDRQDYFEGNNRRDFLLSTALYMDMIDSPEALESFKKMLLNPRKLDTVVVKAAIFQGKITQDSERNTNVFSDFRSLYYQMRTGGITKEQLYGFLKLRLSYVEGLDVSTVEFSMKSGVNGHALVQYDLSSKCLNVILPQQPPNHRIRVYGENKRANGWVDKMINFSYFRPSHENLKDVLGILFPENQLDELRDEIERDPEKYAAYSAEELWLMMLRPSYREKRELDEPQEIERAFIDQLSGFHLDEAIWEQCSNVRAGLRRAALLSSYNTGELQVSAFHPDSGGLTSEINWMFDKLDAVSRKMFFKERKRKEVLEAYGLDTEVDHFMMRLHEVLMDIEKAQKTAEDELALAMGREGQIRHANAILAYVHAWKVCLPFNIADAELAMRKNARGGEWKPDWMAQHELVQSGFDHVGSQGLQEITRAVADIQGSMSAVTEVKLLEG